MNPEDQRWQRLLNARKAAEQASDAARDFSPSAGMVTRISARAAAARRTETLKLWRRWSLYGAAGSACLLFVAIAYTAFTRDAGSLLPIPSLDLPNNL